MMLAKDMFLNYYNTDLNQMALFTTLISSPGLFKIFVGMIIDSRIVPKRKYYLIFFGFWSFIMMSAIGCQVSETAAVILLMLDILGMVFLEVTIESIMI